MKPKAATDVEDKQVRSIEDQIAELRAFAKTEDLEIWEELVEKQSAKIPGRPIFNDMVARIEAWGSKWYSLLAPFMLIP